MGGVLVGELDDAGMICPWHASAMEFLWNSYGVPIEFVWSSHTKDAYFRTSGYRVHWRKRGERRDGVPNSRVIHFMKANR